MILERCNSNSYFWSFSNPAVLLEFALLLDGAVFSPGLVRSLDLNQIVTYFPTVSLGERYTIVDIDINDVFDLQYAFNVVMLEKVDVAHYGSLVIAITAALREANPCKYGSVKFIYMCLVDIEMTILVYTDYHISLSEGKQMFFLFLVLSSTARIQIVGIEESWDVTHM